MSYGLTAEQRFLQGAAREFARSAIAPLADRVYRSDSFPREAFEVLREEGYLTMYLPAEYGGGGSSLLEFCLVVEEVGRICPTSAAVLSLYALGAHVLSYAGDEALKRAYLPRLAAGEILSCFCLTEPGAGSDNQSLKATAGREGEEYVIRGQKQFISNADVADVFTVFARTGGEGGHGISAFLVDRGAPGLSVGPPNRRMGANALHTCPVFFDGVRVPAARRLGPEGMGLRLALRALEHGRPAVAAKAVGLAQGALDYALAYARERVQFSHPIAEFQGIQFMLADMATQIEAARQLMYRACGAVEDGEPGLRRYVAMAKLLATDVAMKATEDAVQIFGGYGMMADSPVERRMAEAKLGQIVDGTNQIQRLLVARSLLQEA